MHTTDPSTYAGHRAHRRSRETGTVIVLLNTAEAGLDPDHGCAWTTLCDQHDSFVCHRTRALAESFMAVPTDWCEECRDSAEAAARRRST